MDKHCYIGYIDETLDKSKANYHHYGTWFRLFSENGTYSIVGTEKNEVAVYKEYNVDRCTKKSIVFQGTLQEFGVWLKNNK